MTSALIILSVIIFFLSVSQLVFVYFLLSKKGLIPTVAELEIGKEDGNEFSESKYLDLSDVTAEEGIKSLINK